MALDMAELAQQNRGLIYKIALTYRDVCALDRATDIDDLMQAGALGVWAAAKSFDPDGGKSWAGWAAFYIKREMRAALGIRSTRRRADLGAVSLYAPAFSSDPDSPTIEETIPDNTLPDIDAGALEWDKRQQIHAAIDRLKDERQRSAIMAQYFAGKSQSEIGAELGITAQRVSEIVRAGFRKLRQDKRLTEIAEIELRTPYYKKIGVNRFNTTMTSAVEYAVLWRDEHYNGGRKHEIQARSEKYADGAEDANRLCE